MNERLPLLSTIFRLLTFQITREELHRLDHRFLIAGLVGTWIVGMGRYWDSPTAEFAQRTGIGSIVYVFVLAALLYGVGYPLKPQNWSYGSVLTFITLTSFPAALYAIPVERWTSVHTAIQINVWFLAIVALYRVGLYLFYMWRSAELGIGTAITTVFLPITLIIAMITISGYAGVVFDVMGGFANREPTAMDGVNTVLTTITVLSCMSLPIWLVAYLVVVGIRARTM
jgi:hypothetical protein